VGGTAAAIYDEEHKEVHEVENGAPPPGSPEPGGTPPPDGIRPIIMLDNEFPEPNIPMPAGEEVVFPVVNDGSATHNVQVAVSGDYGANFCRVGDPGCSDPASIRGGDEGTLTLNLTAGTYEYRCDYHPDEMTGEITAQ
jgi:plastocyanin